MKEVSMEAEELAGTYTYRSFLNRPEPVDEPQAMDVTGHAKSDSPVRFSFTGRGRPGTQIADFHYEYDGILLRRWETGVSQRQTLAGTVLRAEDHGSGATVAPAGQTASFLAVKRDD
jgi:hypothetical protein